jgi:hypothetical protein
MLTIQVVLSSVLSDHTLCIVLRQAGVFHEVEIIPEHFPAKALKVYLGAVFMSGTLSFEDIFRWLSHIFHPIFRWLKLYGLGDYHANRAALAAAGIKVGNK